MNERAMYLSTANKSMHWEQPADAASLRALPAKDLAPHLDRYLPFAEGQDRANICRSVTSNIRDRICKPCFQLLAQVGTFRLRAARAKHSKHLLAAVLRRARSVSGADTITKGGHTMTFSSRLIIWILRVLGLLFLAFLWMFFIGEGNEHPGGMVALFSEPLVMRVTVPLVVVTILVLLTLRQSWVGAAACLLAAMLFGYYFLTNWRGESGGIRSFCILEAILLVASGLFVWHALKRRSAPAGE